MNNYFEAQTISGLIISIVVYVLFLIGLSFSNKYRWLKIGLSVLSFVAVFVVAALMNWWHFASIGIWLNIGAIIVTMQWELDSL